MPLGRPAAAQEGSSLSSASQKLSAALTEEAAARSEAEPLRRCVSLFRDIKMLGRMPFPFGKLVGEEQIAENHLAAKLSKARAAYWWCDEHEEELQAIVGASQPHNESDPGEARKEQQLIDEVRQLGRYPARHNAAKLVRRPKTEQEEKRAEDVLRQRLDKAKKAKKFNEMQKAEIATFEEAFKRMVSEAKQMTMAVAWIQTVRGDATLDIHKREIIEADQVANAVVCYQKLCRLSNSLHQSSSEKRRHSFDLKNVATTSPSDTKKARTLQAAPTDASLPDVGKQ